MRAVVQRVSEARVEAAGERLAEIGHGLAVLIGVARSDSAPDAERLAGKVARLRIFEDEGQVRPEPARRRRRGARRQPVHADRK